jgi:hypothetical protein
LRDLGISESGEDVLCISRSGGDGLVGIVLCLLVIVLKVLGDVVGIVVGIVLCVFGELIGGVL